eukprot:gnl/TRDRNA2_/TRDRNA2_177399_c1_seq1.p1 gnl/TRDRNA2_/TRDRNA2_177399_c1~~gnl/TRDRNA2_/TRDRNA2_177399_c1_seq1.p1  ORF type:complete len:237 (-),score=21.98 gnl/TRDRNA2_/TRDRNA2_177399_c1_seq1:818-1528(-)
MSCPATIGKGNIPDDIVQSNELPSSSSEVIRTRTISGILSHVTISLSPANALRRSRKNPPNQDILYHGLYQPQDASFRESLLKLMNFREILHDALSVDSYDDLTVYRLTLLVKAVVFIVILALESVRQREEETAAAEDYKLGFIVVMTVDYMFCALLNGAFLWVARKLAEPGPEDFVPIHSFGVKWQNMVFGLSMSSWNLYEYFPASPEFNRAIKMMFMIQFMLHHFLIMGVGVGG